ncbi:MAG: histidine phosphatase family protein [Eubacteriales bacterium]|nr:histidine phosphatase family protein [Eubacteriales bacterium]
MEWKQRGCVYFVRHGQSLWNVENKICGSTDVPLTDKGRGQAAETGKKIMEQGIKVDEILYSPLSRAAETAQIISQATGIPAREEPKLTEQNFGRWESTSPRSNEEFRQAKMQCAGGFGGGESMLRLAQRIYNLLDEIRLQSEERTYLLVAHNGIARIVQSYFKEMTNEEFADYGVRNCEIRRFEF